MVLRPVLMISLICALSACTPEAPSSTPTPSTPSAQPATSAQPANHTPASADINTVLPAYHWQLQSATAADGSRIDALFPDADNPIQLDFADGRISISNACNRMSGGYRVDGTSLRIDQMVSTKMACPDPLMAAESAISERLNASALTLELSHGTPPLLDLTTALGDVLNFQGWATPATRFGTPAERVFLEVAPERVTCPHPLIPDHQCLHVREITYDDNGMKTSEGEWQFFYDAIEGYTHEPGIRNVLRLNRHRIPNSPADGSSLTYVLDMVVMSEKVDSEKSEP